MRLIVCLEHEAKTDIVPVAVPALCESLPRIPVPQIVHPVAPNAPHVTDGQTSRMTPYPGGRRIRKILGLLLGVVDVVQPDKEVLIASQGIVKSGDVRV